MKGKNWKLFFSLLIGLQVVLILWSIWLMSTGGNAWIGTFNIALNTFFGWQNVMILIDMKAKEKQTD
jgi:4-amino-4-deoxy-L-arabinose transferase-like glycosyltransferase